MNDKKTSSSLLNRPIKDGSWVYMWIAHYNDGESLPQFDPYTLETHTFKEVNQDKLIKFGLYPIPSNLANKLRKEKGKNVRSNVFLPKYEVNINDDKRVIGALTTNFIEQKAYVTCPNCKSTFLSKDINLIDIGNDIKTYVCPKCGERAYWKCDECGKQFKHIDDTNDWKCTECGTRVNARNRPQFNVTTIQERWRIYKLGYQETVNGKNKKTIMHIQENGDVELKDE
jgi:DNA-directed RNA polymerase subunit RPC12/RpoP